ncbi:hypothetical protein [Kitasatospora azatica]|uniref:hypothetical protein n=1 Tax=Kitasatospora azatica TaxID=58347 RepID=UPI00055E24D7|nr:hypothetical protein [Kitasatospora azatica]
MPTYAETLRLRILAHARIHETTYYRGSLWAEQAPPRTVAHVADPIALGRWTERQAVLLLEPTGAFALARPHYGLEALRYEPAPGQSAGWEPTAGPARHGDQAMLHTGYLFEDRTWLTACGGRVYRTEAVDTANCPLLCPTCQILDDASAGRANTARALLRS